LSFGGFLSAFLAFLVAAAALVVLMFTLALALAAAQERTAEALRASTPDIKRWGGRILVLVGAWFVILGVFADEFAGVFSVRSTESEGELAARNIERLRDRTIERGGTMTIRVDRDEVQRRVCCRSGCADLPILKLCYESFHLRTEAGFRPASVSLDAVRSAQISSNSSTKLWCEDRPAGYRGVASRSGAAVRPRRGGRKKWLSMDGPRQCTGAEKAFAAPPAVRASFVQVGSAPGDVRLCRRRLRPCVGSPLVLLSR
jgi:hypothetical protein